jgi:hypothetical protein
MKPVFSSIAVLVLLVGGSAVRAGDRAPSWDFTTLTYPGSIATSANGMSDNGTVAGDYNDADGNDHGFIWSKGNYTPVDHPGGGQTSLNAINDGGTAVGIYTDASGNSIGFVRARDGMFTDLSYPGGTNTAAVSINNARTVVGYYVGADGHRHGFEWTQSGGFVDVDPPGSVRTTVNGINNKGGGQIFGGFRLSLEPPPPATPFYFGFILNPDGSLRIAFSFPEAVLTIAEMGTNSDNEVVGWIVDDAGNRHGFFVADVLTSNPKYYQIDLPNTAVTYGIYAINGGGDIVGGYQDVAGVNRGFFGRRVR